MPTEIHSEADLEALVRDNPTVAAVFTAGWSRPCRLLELQLAQAESALPKGARLIRADMDALPASAEKLGVRSLPTLVVFRDGRAVRRSVGVQSAAGILEQLR
jgi:thioredoxin 1